MDSWGMARRRARVAILAVLIAAAGLVTAVWAPPAVSAVGGPVILGGDDLTEHGSYDPVADVNEDGWLYLQKALENVAPQVTRAGNDGSIAALGSVDSTATDSDAGGAMHYAAQEAGLTVTYYDGAAAIEAFFTSLRAGTAKPAIVWVAGTDASNDLDSTESAALVNNATTIADFVGSGGGLISHGTDYSWLSALLPGTTTVIVSTSGGDLYLTPEGTAAFPGVTAANFNSGPWHNYFQGNFGGLGVLVRSSTIDDASGNDAAVVLGGAAVTFTPGGSCPPPPSGAIVGTDGPDQLRGTPGPDVIIGKGGNDKIDGLGGDDKLYGCGGVDSIRGGGGEDFISGGGDKDELWGGPGNDTIEGDAGAYDELDGEDGSDSLDGGTGGRDECTGGAGRDTTPGGCEVKRGMESNPS